MVFGLFKKASGAAAGEQAKPHRYAHLGEQAVAEMNRFAAKVGKDWQMAVNHPNFERSPFEMQVKLFAEKEEREMRDGKFPLLAALVANRQVNANFLLFEGMTKAVVKFSTSRMLDTFEKLGRSPE
ncbi:MAG: hypothetical protein GC129_06230 [Proteobacteria bacterium]|nr:hypothetical protein [Pseudomonadota bacterium]